MPEARDRLSREEDLIADFSIRRRTSSIRNIGRGDSPIIFVLEDEVDDRLTAATPFRWRNTPMTGTPGPPIRATIGTPRIGRGTSHFRTPARIAGRENSVAARGRGRGGSVLPSWYPRRPLQDITSVLRAIDRRRARGEEVEGRQLESPILQDRIVRNPSVPSVSDARLEHDISMISPSPIIRVSRCPPSIEKVNRILLSIANQKDGDSDSSTPQKKLLNNIDTVEKVVMEELRKLKRTPSAKKAEREKRVRTLMSMR